MELGGRWGSGLAGAAPCRAVWSSQCWLLAISTGFFHRWRTHGKPWSITSGTTGPPTMAHPQPESSMQLRNSESKGFWYRRKSPGAPQCSFCGPHTPVPCVHHCTRWKMFLRARAGPAPTTAQCFNKCQGWHERSLSEKTDWPSHCKQEAAIVYKMAELLALPRALFLQLGSSPASHVCFADSCFHTLLLWEAAGGR